VVGVPAQKKPMDRAVFSAKWGFIFWASRRPAISGICLGFGYCFDANIILTDVTIKVTLKNDKIL
jgi:hypothetical protein